VLTKKWCHLKTYWLCG